MILKNIILGFFTMLMYNSTIAQDFPREVIPETVPPYYFQRYEGAEKPGELVYGVIYNLWIPPEVKNLRGLIVHQHGCGSGAGFTGLSGTFDLQWQALARKYHCALISPAYEQPSSEPCSMWADPRNGSEATFIKALSDLGETAGHPELADVPWALWGHSGGGSWAGGMAFLHPDRVAALWMNSGTITLESSPDFPEHRPYELTSAALGIPMMCNQGALEGITKTNGRFAHVWTRFESIIHLLRAQGGLIGHAVDPLTEHACGNQRYLAIPWFDACLEARLSLKGGEPMNTMNIQKAWLAPLLGSEAVPATQYEGDIKNSVWLPNQHIAKVWMSYNKDTAVPDETPPPAPRNLTVVGNKLTWEAEADIESGLAYFIIERDDKFIAKIPEADEFTKGRPVFQSLYNGDTPKQPLPEMSFIDSMAIEGEDYQYSITTVNTVGLKSKRLSGKIANAQHFELLSPDNLGSAKVEVDEGNVFFAYSKNGVEAIQKSLLGIEIFELDLRNLELSEVKKDSSRSNWKPLWGTQEIYPDNYNTLVLQMRNEKTETNISFHFRMYNEGLAFKYEVESSRTKVNELKNELTEFNLSNQSTCWILNHPWGKRYESNVPVAEVKGARLPLLSKSPDANYVFISEASLYNYGALSLSAKDSATLSVDIVGEEVLFEEKLSTPWRVIMTAQNPAYFIENKFLIQNLNEPSKVENTAWIKPGISIWDWRARGGNENGFTYQLNTESLVRLVNKTGSIGLPYFMIDAGWYGKEHEKESDPLSCIPNIDMQKILEIAKLKNVGIWLYVNRVAFEENDIDAVLSTYRDWGIVGIKLGFLRKSDQKSVAFLQSVLEKSAEYELMFDCHECVIPSGIERTWPHFLTREYNHSLEDGAYISSPVDHTITPFLNNIAGPIDVTPGFFDIDKMEEREFVRRPLKSTVVAQAAMCLTYFSPLLCLPDIPEAYLRKPDLFEFIKSLPLTYDDTKVLIGEIGTTYVVARRKLDTWWIGGVVNEAGASLEIPLKFLMEGEYEGEIFLDGKDTTWENNREKYKSEKITVNSEGVLELEIVKGGGFCARLEPVK